MEKLERLSEDNKRVSQNVVKHSSFSPLNADSIIKVIQEEGFFPTRCEEGDFQFKIQGKKIIVGECANNFCFLRMAYELDNESMQCGRLVANLVNMRIVAIKTIVFEKNEMVLFSVESYCKSTESFRVFFQQAMSILNDSIGVFWEEMKKTSEPQTHQQGIMCTAISARKESTTLS